MGSSETTFPECCRYCPHRTAVKGTCEHDLRQSLVRAFAEADGTDSPCPIYEDVRADAMARLSERLHREGRDPPG